VNGTQVISEPDVEGSLRRGQPEHCGRDVGGLDEDDGDVASWGRLDPDRLTDDPVQLAGDGVLLS
jgi:hypothetical protein